jgi:hypothetical protein
MATTETARARAPRGTKTVADAFFAALKEIPEVRQAEVAKAAQSAIREMLKLQNDKAKTARAAAKIAAKAARLSAKSSAKKTAKAKPAAKSAAKAAPKVAKKAAKPGRRAAAPAAEAV